MRRPESILAVPWPGGHEPSSDEIGALLAQAGWQASPPIVSLPPPARWRIQVDEPLHAWIDCRPIYRADRSADQPLDLSDGEALSLSTATWELVARAAISTERPLDDLTLQLQLCLDAAATWAPVVHDRSADQWHRTSSLRKLLGRQDPPDPQWLHGIHIVHPDQGDRCWMHTHGLARAGLPDLDFLEVQTVQTGTGVTLLCSVADWVRESGGAAPGDEVLVCAPRLRVGLLHLPDLLMLVHPEAVGVHGRGPEHSPRARLAVVPCGLAAGTSLDHLPDLLLRAVGESRGALLSTRQAQADAAGAQATVPAFREAWRRRHDAGWRFGARFALPTTLGDAPTEHLWFEVLAVEEGVFKVRLMSEPSLAPDLNVGDLLDLSLERLSGWVVKGDSTTYMPEDVPQLQVDLLESRA